MTCSWMCEYLVYSTYSRSLTLISFLTSSNPTSPNYRKYLTVQEVNDLFAPSNESVSAVRNWLQSAGISADRVSLSSNKQWLQFDGAADEVENLLGTQYFIYTHATNGRTHLGCEQ